MGTRYAPISGPSAWEGDNLSRAQWAWPVDSDVLDEFDTVLHIMDAQSKTLEDVTFCDFRTPRLFDFGMAVQVHLRDGLGFLVLEGWHRRKWSESQLKFVLWGICSLLGEPRVQNLRGERVSVVAKAPPGPDGKPVVGDSTVSKGDDEVRPHTEKGRLPQAPRLIALLCVQPSLSGGESTLLSGHAIFNRLLRDQPGVVDRLFDKFPFGRHTEPHADGRLVDWAPVFRFVDGRLVVRYNRPWVHVAEQSLGRALDEEALRALDAFEYLLEDPKLPLTARMGAGDLVIADNRIVLHARRQFTDGIGEHQRRRLLRAWVD